MAEDLFVDEGDDGNLWIESREWGTAVAVCREVNGKWFVEAYDFNEEVGPSASLDDLLDHIEDNKLWAPWGSPGV